MIITMFGSALPPWIASESRASAAERKELREELERKTRGARITSGDKNVTNVLAHPVAPYRYQATEAQENAMITAAVSQVVNSFPGRGRKNASIKVNASTRWNRQAIREDTRLNNQMAKQNNAGTTKDRAATRIHMSAALDWCATKNGVWSALLRTLNKGCATPRANSVSKCNARIFADGLSGRSTTLDLSD
jgi:hypothetical protein